MSEVRGRYAPSPTGHMTVGNAYTAIRAWLDVRSRGGTFVLRLDDTDPSRTSVSVDDITSELGALGLVWDEGPDIGGLHAPYQTSRRQARHQEMAERLVARGSAYWDYSPPIGDVDLHKKTRRDIRRSEEANGAQTAYRGSSEPVEGIEPVLRLRVTSAEVSVGDRVFGRLSVAGDDISEVALLRSDGRPTYHLASTVDDIDMEITSVVRGADWLNYLPQHVLLFEALGAAPPEFAHVPLLLGEDGSKLSKRHGDLSIEHLLADQGVPAEALCAYLANLGFPSRSGIPTLNELAEEFDIRKMNRAAPRFDPKKLESFSRRWFAEREPEEQLIRQMIERTQGEKLTAEEIRILAPGVKSRVATYEDAATLSRFLGVDDRPGRDAELVSDEMAASLLGTTPWTADALEDAVGAIHAAYEDKKERRARLTALRDALAPGFKVTPPLHYLLAALGPERSRTRLDPED